MKRAIALAVLPVLAIAGCSDQVDEAAEAKATNVPKAVAAAPQASGPAVESEFGTPVKDRVATIGLLNKRNNLSQDLVMKSGEAKRAGNVVVRVASCERSLPWEMPPEIGAFVQVFVEERAKPDQPLAWRTAFSGWLFKHSPSVNAVEHPVYDVWVKDCAMKFPGEEDVPAAASSSNAAKPAGSASAAPSAKPSPKPSPRPSPTPDIGRAEANPNGR
jgi:hypothetical protein